MEKQSPAHLLSELEQYSRSKNLSKKDMARNLGVPYSTYKKWFKIKERNPSSVGIQKIKSFLESKKETDKYWKELWVKILNWWETQHQYSSIREFADEVGWEAQSLNNYFQSKEIPPKLIIEKIAKTGGFEVPALAYVIQESQRRTEKIKNLLLFLEEELRWFRDHSKEARDILRKELDLDDIGYISSLLTMLGDEGKFKRWLTLTSNRFNFFKKKGGKNEKGTH